MCCPVRSCARALSPVVCMRPVICARPVTCAPLACLHVRVLVCRVPLCPPAYVPAMPACALCLRVRALARDMCLNTLARDRTRHRATGSNMLTKCTPTPEGRLAVTLAVRLVALRARTSRGPPRQPCYVHADVATGMFDRAMDADT